jgi:hypothetical protein
VGRRGGSTQSRTRTNRIVHLASQHAPGDFLDARIVSATPHHLAGEVVTAPAPV